MALKVLNLILALKHLKMGISISFLKVLNLILALKHLKMGISISFYTRGTETSQRLRFNSFLKENETFSSLILPFHGYGFSQFEIN